jgi:hypothetical protein
MNPKYCGGAKDLFKRGFLNLVRSFSLVRGPKVLPLCTGEFNRQMWQLTWNCSGSRMQRSCRAPGSFPSNSVEITSGAHASPTERVYQAPD